MTNSQKVIQAWLEANTLDDIESEFLRHSLKDASVILSIVKESFRRRGTEARDLAMKDLTNFIDAVVSNIAVEIARREMAYDRSRLKDFQYLKIEDMVVKKEFEANEFVRAHLMRHRERTGEELTEEELKETNITI